ncbi:hypothetical protein Tco_0015960 [Tanacetum coccineum]
MNQVNEPIPPKFSPTGSGPSPRGRGHDDGGSMPTLKFQKTNQVNEPIPPKFSPTGSGPSPRGKGHEGDSMPTSRFLKSNQVNESMPPKFLPTGSGPSPRGKGHEGDSMPTSRFQKINQVNEPMPPKFSPTGSGPSPRGRGHDDGGSMPTSKFQKTNQVNEPIPPKFSPTKSGPAPGEGHPSLLTGRRSNGHSAGVGHYNATAFLLAEDGPSTGVGCQGKEEGNYECIVDKKQELTGIKESHEEEPKHVPMQTEEEDPLSIDVPRKTKEKDPLPIDVPMQIKEEDPFKRGEARYCLGSLGPIQEEVVVVKKPYSLVKVTNVVLGLRALKAEVGCSGYGKRETLN